MAQVDTPGVSRPLLLVVAAALVDAHGRVLLQQRPPGKALAGLWEFPGGKLEPGETPEGALMRELAEELDVMVEPDSLNPFAFSSHAYPDFHLLMPLYVVREWRGEPQPRAASALAWVAPGDLARYPTPPADEPLFARLAKMD